MIYNKTDALEAVVTMAVADIHPTELRDIAAKLPEDFSDALEEFCKRFDLGEWFYDSLTVAEVDIVELLHSIADDAETDITALETHDAQINSDLRRANGWPA